MTREVRAEEAKVIEANWNEQEELHTNDSSENVRDYDDFDLQTVYSFICLSYLVGHSTFC